MAIYNFSFTMRLFAYKQTHDTGFAPNPFHGVCTLATCKPRIRLHKQEGDWIAGFTSMALNGDAVGHERLIYLMRVSAKFRLETYHADPRFAAKIPKQRSDRCVETMGDNIYCLHDGALVQVPNRNHDAKNIERDISGKYALIGTTFAYFGSDPLVIPDALRPEIPHGQAGHGVRTDDVIRARAFIDYVMAQGVGIHARPTSWKTGDTTWKPEPST